MQVSTILNNLPTSWQMVIVFLRLHPQSISLLELPMKLALQQKHMEMNKQPDLLNKNPVFPNKQPDLLLP